MFKLLFLLFITIPLIEIYVLIEVGSGIGGFTTIALCLFTAGLGAFLVRYQGVQTLLQAQQAMMQGQAPAQHVLHGVILALTGILLLTPGFLTDAIGFLLLIPAVRNRMIARIAAKAQSQTQHRQHSHFETVIEAEIIEQDRDKIR